MCFSGRKTPEERKICHKICLLGFPELFVMGSAATAACKVASSTTLIGPLNLSARGQNEWPLALTLSFKWANQSWGWIHLASGRCRGPHHKHLRKTEEANCKANFSSFDRWSTCIWREIYWAFMEVLVLLRFETFPFEEKAICGVTSG